MDEPKTDSLAALTARVQRWIKMFSMDDARQRPQALNALDLLRDLLPVLGAQGWQPIETAPKDGTWIHLYQPDNGDNIACWMDCDISWWFIDISWWFIEDGKNAHALRGAAPTHWRPCPDPPASLRAPTGDQ